jgi:hypothetical protein
MFVVNLFDPLFLVPIVRVIITKYGTFSRSKITLDIPSKASVSNLLAIHRNLFHDRWNQCKINEWWYRNHMTYLYSPSVNYLDTYQGVVLSPQINCAPPIYSTNYLATATAENKRGMCRRKCERRTFDPSQTFLRYLATHVFLNHWEHVTLFYFFFSADSLSYST